jgi:large subunit ribosomal protein L34
MDYAVALQGSGIIAKGFLPCNQNFRTISIVAISCFYLTRGAAHGIVEPPRGAHALKRTHQPKKRQRVKVHGFRARMSTAGGVKVIKARRRKGRRRLTPTSSRRAR